MIRRLSRAAALGAALLVALGAARAEPARTPRFLQQLLLPVAGDQIGFAHCVTADATTGEVFVCDPRRNRILIFDADGFFDFQIPGGEGFSSPEDVAVDPSGRIVVLGTHERRRMPIELDFDGAFLRALPLRGLPEDGDPPKLVSIALSPVGDRLYAIDGANNRLWIADRDGSLVAAADLAVGESPEDLEDLAFGHVDVYGERVLVTVPSGGQVLIFGLDGAPRGHAGLKGGARCQLGYPTAAALDGQGDLWIVDQQRMILSRWRIEGNRCLAEHLGIGAAPGYLYFPYDLALDPRGRAYIAQSYGGRVQVYTGLGAEPAPGLEQPAPDPQ